MLDFFENIIAYFEAYNIPYMLSGSIAMGFYILPRATRDIDFVVHLQLSDVDGVIDHFNDEYYCSKEAIIDAVNRKSYSKLSIVHPAIKQILLSGKIVATGSPSSKEEEK